MSYNANPLEINTHLLQFSLHQNPSSASSPASSTTSSTPTRRQHSSKPNPHHRSRVSKACQRCRVRKVKCDGGKPCVRCVEVDDICDYTRLSRNRDTKEYSQSYVDTLLEQNSKYKAAMKVLYANRRLSIHPDDMTLPSTEGKDVPLVHDILERLGLLEEGEASLKDERDAEFAQANGEELTQTWSNAETVSSSAASVTWASTFDFNGLTNDNQTPTGPIHYAASSSANTEYESYKDANMNYNCSNGYFDPRAMHNFSMEARHSYEEPVIENLDFDMGPSVSFEDLEAVGNLMSQNTYMEGVLGHQSMMADEMLAIWS